MKKLTALLLTCMLLFTLAACGTTAGTSGENSSNSSSASTMDTQKETAETKQSEPAEAVEDNRSSSDENAETPQTDAPANSKNEITFTELVVADNEECFIKITGIEPDARRGCTLKVLLENKSAEKTYMYTVDAGAVNGVDCDPFFAAEVAAGKKSNEKITFSTRNFKENDIGAYTDIELTFRVYDSNDWLADPVAKQTVHVYPYGEEKAVAFVREPLDTDTVLVDNDYVTVIATGYEEDAICGYTVNLFLLNKTDKNIMFCVDDASINGFMLDPFYAKIVAAGKCAFSSMSWSKSKLEENDITAIEAIEFKFRAYDSDNWRDDDFANELVTLNP